MSSFRFKSFTVQQADTAMKVTTDACLFGAVVAAHCRLSEGNQVLDIGCGTGLLSLMMAQMHNNVSIDAIEIDKKSFEQAKANIGQSPWPDRIHPLHADARTLTFSHTYHLIIANPPFYEKQLSGPDASRNRAHHDTGLVLADLLHIIAKAMHANGEAWVLLPAYRKPEVFSIASECSLKVCEYSEVHPHQGKKASRVIVRLTALQNNTSLIHSLPKSICVYEANNHYHPLFVSYLQAYYLYL